MCFEDPVFWKCAYIWKTSDEKVSKNTVRTSMRKTCKNHPKNEHKTHQKSSKNRSKKQCEHKYRKTHRKTLNISKKQGTIRPANMKILKFLLQRRFLQNGVSTEERQCVLKIPCFESVHNAETNPMKKWAKTQFDHVCDKHIPNN